MIEICLSKISKNYGYNQVLNDLTFDIKTGERVALIGSNGCGKTTTLRLIMGKETPDNGTVSIRNGVSIGYLTQIPEKENDNVTAREVYLRGLKELIDLENKIKNFINNMNSSSKELNELGKLQEEFRIKGGYQLNGRIEKIRNGFKLDNSILNNYYNNLSGGEKTIVNLASLVLSNPDILLLDEPTNHLDIDTLEWFEEYLKTYKGTIVIVSHDRYFLDHVINKIICLENGNADIYCGNYSYYIEESEKRLMLQFQAYKNQQKKIKAMEEAIERLKAWGTKSDNPIFFRRAESMQKRLDKMVKVEEPKEKIDLKINLTFNDRSANHVLTIDNLNLSIDNKELLIMSSMDVNYKERVCLMGKNGSGKTTLIKNILNNTHNNIKIGVNVQIGYIPQEIRFENDNLTIYDYMKSIFVGSESELRSKLYRFYFDSESIFKKLKSLSGGEKVRIKLLELILCHANFLILDEPTNHIDIDTREILESSLLDFDGTILFISHDRYFINKLATKIVRIENKKLVTYMGNYDSIKEPKITTGEKKAIKEEVNIKGSKRLTEFLKDATKIELISSSLIKVYKIRKKSKIFYLKTANHLSNESIRLEYLKDKLLIPEKVFYEKYNDMSYILMKEVKGEALSSEYYCFNPNEGIDIIVSAFNNLYNIDYSDCILDETIDTKIKSIENNNGKINDDLLKKYYTKEGIIKYLKGNKPKQIIGFTHGKLTLNNIYAFKGEFSGFIDIGHSGLCDIYFDLVSCEMSIEKYYGVDYVNVFYDKIGIEKDELKSQYYRVLINMLK